MGSWNETCAVSRLAIYSGEPVRFLPIMQSPWSHEVLSGHKDGDKAPVALSGKSGTYINDFWWYFCFPIRGVYNDYGTIENVPNKTKQDKAEIEQFLHIFRANAIPLKLGENEYHDLATTDLTLESTLECLQEGRVWVHCDMAANGVVRPILPVAWMMIKEHVWQSLLAYNLGKADSFVQYVHEKRGEVIPTVATRKEAYDKRVESERAAGESEVARALASLRMKRSLAFHDSFNGPLEILALRDHVPHLTQIAAELDQVHCMLSYLRVTIAPTTGSGSQGENLDTWADMSNKWIKDEKAAQKKRFAD